MNRLKNILKCFGLGIIYILCSFSVQQLCAATIWMFTDMVNSTGLLAVANFFGGILTACCVLILVFLMGGFPLAEIHHYKQKAGEEK